MNEQNGFSLSGLLQGVATTTLGYLDRRIDIDLQQRLASRTTPGVTSTQTPVANTVPNQAFGMSTNTMMVVGIAALLAVVLLKA